MNTEDAKGVMLAVLASGWIRAELADALIRMSHDGRYRLNVTFSWARPIPSNRQRIVKAFLESDYDYLMMLDDDVWPYRNCLDLVEDDRDVVLFPTPVWRPGTDDPPIVSVITTLDGGTVNLDESAVVEVRAGGSAFLIARRVLETLEPPQFEYVFDDWGMMDVEEDINFCRKARAAGFKIWAAYSHPCGHIKEVDLVDLHNEVKEWN